MLGRERPGRPISPPACPTCEACSVVDNATLLCAMPKPLNAVALELGVCVGSLIFIATSADPYAPKFLLTVMSKNGQHYIQQANAIRAGARSQWLNRPQGTRTNREE